MKNFKFLFHPIYVYNVEFYYGLIYPHYNEFGLLGWELVTIIQDQNRFQYVFKRRLNIIEKVRWLYQQKAPTKDIKVWH